jgi:hypothetical protein
MRLSEVLLAEQIITDIAARTKLSFRILVGPVRTHYVAKARHEAMAAIKEKVPVLSLPLIGRIFNRDHTSVLYGIQTHTNDPRAKAKRERMRSYYNRPQNGLAGLPEKPSNTNRERMSSVLTRPDTTRAGLAVGSTE